MLMMIERRDEARVFLDELRSRIAADHPDRVRSLFPAWFSDQDDAVDPEPDVEWRVPTSPGERADLERWIASHSSGVVGAADVGSWL